MVVWFPSRSGHALVEIAFGERIHVAPGLTSGGKVAEGHKDDETETDLLGMSPHPLSVTGNCSKFMFT